MQTEILLSKLTRKDCEFMYHEKDYLVEPDDFYEEQEYLDYIADKSTDKPENKKEIEGQITFDQLIKPENHFHLLENGYYKFKVVNCEQDVLPETSSKPARPIIRLRLDIENDEANVVINHIIFLNQYNNKEIHEFFSSIGLAKDREYITKWNIWGRTGACKVIRKDLDFKTVNAIDHFVTQN